MQEEFEVCKIWLERFIPHGWRAENHGASWWNGLGREAKTHPNSSRDAAQLGGRKFEINVNSWPKSQFLQLSQISALFPFHTTMNIQQLFLGVSKKDLKPTEGSF